MASPKSASLLAATPVLPSLNIARTVEFYCDTLGFDQVHAVPREYAIVDYGPVELHFWHTEDPALPKVSGCRVKAAGIGPLYAHCEAAGIVHPNAALVDKPWGTREFGILDPDGNLLTFYESTDA